MKFNEYVYTRPDLEQVKAAFKKYMTAMENAKSADEFHENFKKLTVVTSNVDSMYTLSSIRHTIDTSDEFYNAENDYWDENMPYYQQLTNGLYKLMVASPFRSEMEKRLPVTYFQLADNLIRAFSDEIIEDLQNENRLVSKYEKLIASADIEFEGNHYNLSQLNALTTKADRSLRERSFRAYLSFFEEHESEIDTIYDELVHLRDKIAKKLGFNNFTELGYVRMNRLDYNEEMVKSYRSQVLADVVPLANELYAKQKVRLGLDTMQFYDEKCEFLNGNPTPVGTSDELVKKAQKMYHELSKETGEFFDFMVEHELLDLVAKPKKASGGYCTFIANEKAPFIFSNFNGTLGDVDVLTHEAGHAFQVYQSKDVEVSECLWPTNESCEIHSMSMEFIAWPWSKDFFEEDADKYHYLHLGDAVKFIPYGICVDHFQHEVYNNPDMTPDERKAMWRSLEKQYLPHKNYEGSAHLEKGCWWFRQSHIFASPFYYIDYTLAQMCALQFWKRSQENDPEYWNDYLHLCSLGGTKSFLNLLKEAHLKSPFVEGSLHELMQSARSYLMSIDDLKL